jgi:hypothetical protein
MISYACSATHTAAAIASAASAGTNRATGNSNANICLYREESEPIISPVLGGLMNREAKTRSSDG